MTNSKPRATQRRVRKSAKRATRRRSATVADSFRPAATRAEKRIKALLERLIHIQERERQRIALNLHDQLGQQLTALRLAVDALKVGPVPDGLLERLDVIDRLVTQIDHDVDFLAWELRPAALDDTGLETALEQFLARWAHSIGLMAEFHATPSNGFRMPREVESQLYRIAQEGLHNIGKHAGASQVSLLIERRPTEVRLIIEDNGTGFDVDLVKAHPQRGIGLVGMYERAASIGAHFECESTPGQGTTLFVRVPLIFK